MPDLKLTKRPGSDNWYVRGTDSDGREIFRSLKTKDEATAKALLVKHQARVLEERVHGKIATTKFDEAARAYIKAGGDRTYLAREDSKGEIHGLVPYFGGKPLKDITQGDLDQAAIKLCRPGASRETLIRNVYTPFVAVWRFAASATRKWAEPRQWERPKKQKGTGNRAAEVRAGTTPVSYERAWEFVSAMSPAPAMVMTTLFYTGMRPIELFALECDDINVDGRWITVRFSKTGEPRGVPMHEVLVPLLAALKARGGCEERPAVFLDRHGLPYRITEKAEGINGQLKGAITGARQRLATNSVDASDISPYTARHTVSTQLVINGIHPHIKDQILGHAVDDMSRNYTKVPRAPLIEAINTLPAIPAWQNAEWMRDPILWQSKLTRWENFGRAGKAAKAALDGNFEG
ncbi:tyrosine-type recombinase/integrase [Sinorhizobium meliloti]|nr:tyrosine-type recombinase/integrase [Sinorhizobium meliloti]